MRRSSRLAAELGAAGRFSFSENGDVSRDIIFPSAEGEKNLQGDASAQLNKMSHLSTLTGPSMSLESDDPSQVSMDDFEGTNKKERNDVQDDGNKEDTTNTHDEEDNIDRKEDSFSAENMKEKLWQEKLKVKENEISYLNNKIAALKNEISMKDELNIEKSDAIHGLELKITEQENHIEFLNNEMNDCCQAISKLQDVYNAKITRLQAEIEICDRRVQNAKYLSEANAVLARESQLLNLQSDSECIDLRLRLDRASANVKQLTQSKILEELNHASEKNMAKAASYELEIRDLSSQPSLHLPMYAPIRRRIADLQEKLNKINKHMQSEEEMKHRLHLIRQATEALCTACCGGDIFEVEKLIYQGVSVSSRDFSGFSPLLYACREGHLAIVKILLNKGADVEDETGDLRPLGVAASQGNLDIVRYLIEEGGANVESSDSKGGKVALHHACLKGHEKLAEYLIEVGATINIEDANGNTPLHCSAMHGHTMTAILLIDFGAKVSQRNRASSSALEIAQQKRFSEFVVTISRYIGQDVAFQGDNFQQKAKTREIGGGNKTENQLQAAFNISSPDKNNIDISNKKENHVYQQTLQQDDILEDAMSNTFVSALTT